ncbi:hypothetical protein ACQWQC_002879 [Listeria monocytogenes]|uniref:Uncharacterized protein n=1 Tax=Listeria monocytogenes TaxID=1639 RepID=A0A630PQG8_LISMN|nr:MULTISPECIES: hypothetical protein [Listeria]EAF1769666.1 hypothetical protein [Listeria monocytogenes]EAF1799224.1 hypothetical protein [Listeria monocytogenes]EAF1809121.1 hypothetical protein [Listeria monocytogenes]EAF1818789.1 hypothetical protein [Listeria monocytogenes]EAF1824556.1 hypothetical protein [Listeria monocytogenes]
MNEVLVSANYEGYESKSINFTEINNIVKERFKKIDESERKKRAETFNKKYEVTKELVNGHLREIIIPRRTL